MEVWDCSNAPKASRNDRQQHKRCVYLWVKTPRKIFSTDLLLAELGLEDMAGDLREGEEEEELQS